MHCNWRPIWIEGMDGQPRWPLVALQVADLTEVPNGFRMLIRRCKTDQSEEGQEIVIPRGLKIRPTEAVQAWLQAAGISAVEVAAAKLMKSAA